MNEYLHSVGDGNLPAELASNSGRKPVESDSSGALIAQLENCMLNLPQAECPVIHRFGPGIYVREVHMAAGTLAIGHEQRFEQTNMMLAGRVLMFNPDGSKTELVAPLFFIGQPGRKIGFILEDVIWQNIFPNPTDERDIDVLESMFLIKSEPWQAMAAAKFTVEHSEHEEDRVDYLRVLDESGFSHETARAQSENEADQIPFPVHIPTLLVLDSPIEGKGLFTSIPVEAGALIAPARIFGMRTPAGRYTNHSIAPNACMVMRENGDIDLIAIRRIDGCRGGGPGEEITIDYRQALSLSGIHFRNKETSCLE